MPDGGSVNGTRHAECYAPRGRHTDAPWFCVWTKPQQERVALQMLQEEGFPAYLPLHSVILANRSRRVDCIFPRYLFVQATPDGQWVRMLHTRGVSGLIRRMDGTPSVVPRRELDTLLSQCAPNGVIYPPEPRSLQPDETGRVTSGPMADFSGVCRRATQDRVWLLLTIMGRPTEIGFPRSSVELIPQGH